MKMGKALLSPLGTAVLRRDISASDRGPGIEVRRRIDERTVVSQAICVFAVSTTVDCSLAPCGFKKFYRTWIV